MNFIYVIPATTGFLIGAAVGMTVVGGGSLMASILVLLVGYAPHTAIGTDMLFTCVTKSVGLAIRSRRGMVDWQMLRRLSFGTILAAVVANLCIFCRKLGRAARLSL